jgi:N-acylglucosamine-6-phosphate 2-epimerase
MSIRAAYTAAEVAERVRGRLIVSCQALPSEPLYGSAIMARMALAAQHGGAAAIRANTPEDIVAIRAAVDLPIIGLYKVDVPGIDVYITPRLQDAEDVADAGADVIAFDATDRPHPEGTVADFIRRIKTETCRAVMADISTFDEAIAAREAGADFVSTTMSGYTPYSLQQEGPDIELVRRLARDFGDAYPLIAEGRIATPEQMRAAFDAGAWAVVVGGAITRPQQITARFVKALPHPEHGA